MSLATRRIYIFRDVVFHEHVFPFTLSSKICNFPSVLRNVQKYTIPVCFDPSDSVESRSQNNTVNDHKFDTNANPDLSLNYTPVNEHQSSHSHFHNHHHSLTILYYLLMNTNYHKLHNLCKPHKESDTKNINFQCTWKTTLFPYLPQELLTIPCHLTLVSRSKYCLPNTITFPLKSLHLSVKWWLRMFVMTVSQFHMKRHLLTLLGRRPWDKNLSLSMITTPGV